MAALPNHALYVQNLDEKLKKDEMKRCLYALFGQFGKVIDVVCMKTPNLRGQAWIVYADIASATNALRATQEFPFFGKNMRVQYAKTKSDAIAKLDGSWRKDKRTRAESLVPQIGLPGEGGATEGTTIDTRISKGEEDVGSSNNVLFLRNLPDATNDAMLAVLFAQFPGFKETRLVPGKPGIAFVEFDTELQAGVALSALQGFKITPQHGMQIAYANR